MMGFVEGIRENRDIGRGDTNENTGITPANDEAETIVREPDENNDERNEADDEENTQDDTSL